MSGIHRVRNEDKLNVLATTKRESFGIGGKSSNSHEMMTFPTTEPGIAGMSALLNFAARHGARWNLPTYFAATDFTKSGNLGIWGPANPEIWRSGDLEMQKLGVQQENLKIQIRSAPNVGKVWISRKKILPAPFGAI